MVKEKIDELLEMAKPIEAYLAENVNPYTSIVITRDGVKVLETVAHVPSENCD